MCNTGFYLLRLDEKFSLWVLTTEIELIFFFSPKSSCSFLLVTLRYGTAAAGTARQDMCSGQLTTTSHYALPFSTRITRSNAPLVPSSTRPWKFLGNNVTSRYARSLRTVCRNAGIPCQGRWSSKLGPVSGGSLILRILQQGDNNMWGTRTVREALLQQSLAGNNCYLAGERMLHGRGAGLSGRRGEGRE